VNPQTIMVVDDDPTMLALLEITLKRYGFVVTTVNNPLRALDLLSARPDLIILDMMMPEMDGAELCKRIRTYASAAQTPIIMWSSLSEKSSMQRGLDAGADAYVSKTGSNAALVATVRKFLDRMDGLTTH